MADDAARPGELGPHRLDLAVTVSLMVVGPDGRPFPIQHGEPLTARGTIRFEAGWDRVTVRVEEVLED